ncbi:MAG: ABC transporter ATP-binding protein/permease [Firmicutes bacterium]|nr:ABC transporter ATP-binding protein/permease [Candidatus Colivicinus equi]
MLQVKNIKKTYTTGNLTQVALNNVSLNLRDNEFVAILGPSGSGKTTLLNIIGGLDRYDSGDLLINGISTQNYKDRDWDAYRNHTIGFVFQSYNLIPHQNVLSNVELALTISGIGKKERKQRAMKALEEVGLADQAHKKPNQMSGGQMQRVAIARALVNNPDILLADEPTGALDTKTSVQVMELLKEVAKDRLVVMVTHNPELANEYANRIINLRDGVITGDSNPYEVSQELDVEQKKFKRASMGIFTALSLSFNNLLTKKGRTILTAFAGSIGIIGIALILSLSTGFQNYIDKIQEDTLSSYPLTITSETADATSAILSMVTDRKENQVEGENLIERQYLSTMFSAIGTNDLKTFKKYIEDNMDEIKDDVQQIRYTYSISPWIYTYDATDELVRLNPSTVLSSMYSSNSISLMSSFSSTSGIFSEINDDLDSIKEQYDVLKGRWPENYDEIIIVLSEPNSISDLLTYSLGLKDTAELKTIIADVMAGEETSVEHDPLRLTYDDLLNLDLRLIKATDTYKYNDKYDIYEDMSDDSSYMDDIYNKSLKLKVVGVVCQKEGGNPGSMSAGVCYTRALTEYIIDEAKNTDIVKKQLANKDVDVFSGKRFDEENKEEEEGLNFEDMISVDEDLIKEAFQFNIDEDSFNFETMSENDMKKVITNTTNNILNSINDAQVTTETKQSISMIYMSLLQGFTNAYDQANITPIPEQEGSYILNIAEENVNAFASTITPETCKKSINNFNSDLTPMLSAESYDKMADDLKAAFIAYYKAIEPYANNDVVAYTSQEIKYMDQKIATSVYINIADPSQMITGMQLLSTSTYPEIDYVCLDLIKSSAIAAGIGTATGQIMAPLADSLSGLGDMFGEDMMKVDTEKFAQAFKFDMDQDELSRIMTTMMTRTQEKTYSNNVIGLGYQNIDDPSSMSFYFKDFTSKENFMAFLDRYNDNNDEDHQLRYTDITGLLMSSVKKIVDSVSYVLIAFVSISLVVSSIMIAVITLISVMERTKEIGILRAMGASKRNVSSIFNAETFIIGLLSGAIGVGVTLLAIPPINSLIHNLTDNYNINAVLPTDAAIVLVLISVFLTIFAGIIPSKKASRQDPVVALRSE